MQISIETVRRLWASGRNYANYGLGFATAMGVMSAAQQKTVTDGLSDIYEGVSQVVHGATSIWQVGVVVLGPVVGAVLARWASNSATTKSQGEALKVTANTPTDPQAQAAKAVILDAAGDLKEVVEPIKVSDAALARAVPSEKVVSQ